MTLTYKLEATDYLQYYLYDASKSESTKKRQRQSWLLTSVCCLPFAFLFYLDHDWIPVISLSIFSLGTFIFYPSYQRNKYASDYLRQISETHKNRFGQLSTIRLLDNQIECIDFTGETKINWTSIAKIIETGHYIYLAVQTGGHLIIPKDRIDDLPALRKTLIQASERLSISYETELDWKWK
ncbi:MAG: YcxB family protein [Chitinophagaceae bacterium]